MDMFYKNELTSTARILVLYVSPYDMLNERQEKVTGCTVRYLFWGENGEALARRNEWDPRKPVGVQVAKCSVDIAQREKMPVAPAIYDGDFVTTIGGDGKPVLRLRDVSYVCNICIVPQVLNGFSVPGMVTPDRQPVSYDVIPRVDQSVNPAAGTPAGQTEASAPTVPADNQPASSAAENDSSDSVAVEKSGKTTRKG